MDLRVFVALLLSLLIAAASFCAAAKHEVVGHQSQANASNYKYKFVKEASTAPQSKSYDYIIVGGGATGCPLAATLSQTFSVLLLERGGVPYGVKTIERRDGFHVNLLHYNKHTSVAQGYRTEDGVLVHRGRVLGGGTAINAGFYTRASHDEVKMFGWEGKAVNESYRWVEKKVAFKPVVPAWQMALKSALIEAGVTPDNGFTYEHVVGTKVSGTIFDSKGVRHTSADLLEYAEPRNIEVIVHGTVSKIIFDRKAESSSSKSTKPRATGVIFKDENGVSHWAFVKGEGEVIVSAGAVGSPQLLQLSGIGPEKELSKLKIPLVLDHPNVGQGMADNPNNVILNAGQRSEEYSLLEVVGITKFGSYIEELSGGPNTTGLVQCFVQMLKNPDKVVSPAYMPLIHNPPDFIKEYLPQLTYIVQKVAGPKSKGSLKLLTTDVRDNPSVKFNYYQHPDDLRTCVNGVKVISKAIKAPAFQKFTYQATSKVPDSLAAVLQAASGFVPPDDITNNTALEQFCRDTVITIWHAHGGCLVGSVVDAEHKVLGVDALRVIDISTLNSTPGANPQATMMMLGRYMGLQILQNHSKHNHNH